MINAKIGNKSVINQLYEIKRAFFDKETRKGWQHGIVVASLGLSMKLPHVEPG